MNKFKRVNNIYTCHLPSSSGASRVWRSKVVFSIHISRPLCNLNISPHNCWANCRRRWRCLLFNLSLMMFCDVSHRHLGVFSLLHPIKLQVFLNVWSSVERRNEGGRSGCPHPPTSLSTCVSATNIYPIL